MSVVVVMGVSGVGKTTVATALAAELGCEWLDADTLHSPEAIATMAAGRPLDDAQRWPWLHRVADWIDGCLAHDREGVVACSALARAHRDVLRRDGVRFLLLEAPRTTVAARLRDRPAHFMPPSLLDSQLATLEPPAPWERAVAVEATGDVTTTVAQALTALHLHPTGGTP